MKMKALIVMEKGGGGVLQFNVEKRGGLGAIQMNIRCVGGA